jgi:predicted AAA+ superfamily ATPase
MGSCASAPQERQNPLQKARTKGIDDRLTVQQKQERTIIKVLLLGAGECGKSTILKQLKIVNSVPFKSDEMKVYKDLAYR